MELQPLPNQSNVTSNTDSQALSGMIEEGDLVTLNNIDEDFVKAELKKIYKISWDKPTPISPMLGKTYSVKSKFRFLNDDNIVALQSLDGSDNGRWYFPQSVWTKVQCKY